MASKVGRLALPFTNGFYRTRSRQFSVQDCINWYPIYAENQALSPSSLVPTPGAVEAFPSTGGGPGRGAWLMNGKPYFVAGNKLLRIDRTIDVNNNENLDLVEIGEILGTTSVRMASNKNQLVVVVPGEYAYIYTEGGSLELISDPDFDGPVDDVVSLDSVFVFCKTGTNKIFHSLLNQGESYGALDFTLVNQVSFVRGLIAYRNQLYAMGDNAIVSYVNVGGLEFLFQAIPNAVIDSGLAAVHAKANSRGAFVYLGGGMNEDLGLWIYAGGAPQKISSDAIDGVLKNATPEDISRAYLLQYSQNGAEFIVLTIGGQTFTYDFAASLIAGQKIWAERNSRIPVDTGHTSAQWRVRTLTQAYNRLFVTDIVDDRIGQLSDDTYTEYGYQIRRQVTTQPFLNMGARTRVISIEAYMDTGNDEDDEVALSWSDDGGYTWSQPLHRKLGAVGEYGRRIIWDRLGSAPNARVLRFTYNGSSPCAFNKLMANVI